jgi:energy-converting hydrogenase Eha subunit C
MGNGYRRYIAAETGISILINVIFSALFMFAVFGRTASIDLWGGHGLAVDFVPQTFMISAMSVLVPTLVLRKRVGRGVLKTRSGTPPRLLSHLALRVLLLSGLFTIILGGIGVVILSASWAGPLRFWQAFPLKLVYGGIVALIATPIGLVIALSEPAKSTA